MCLREWLCIVIEVLEFLVGTDAWLSLSQRLVFYYAVFENGEELFDFVHEVVLAFGRLPFGNLFFDYFFFLGIFAALLIVLLASLTLLVLLVLPLFLQLLFLGHSGCVEDRLFLLRQCLSAFFLYLNQKLSASFLSAFCSAWLCVLPRLSG